MAKATKSAVPQKNITLSTQSGTASELGKKPTFKNLSTSIVPIQLPRIRQSVFTWRDAVREAEFAYFPYRYKMQQLYVDTDLNGHVTACVERRKDLTLLRKFEFVNAAGTVDKNAMEIFTTAVKDKVQPKAWFSNLLGYILDANFFGYSLIALGDIVNNEFPDLNIVRRWDISPDRLQVTVFPYQPNGFNFLEDPYKNWHIWVPTPNNIGTSKCGYGLYYKVAIYEIFLRNLYGFNGDFVEMYAQPYRVGKTTKTEEDERAEFAQVLAQMGSNGWAMIDPVDEIEFLESALGGTGYKGYDNFDQRLQKLISKVLLGHSDAMDSTPGKLGSGDGEFSPGQKALEDKQTKDGTFVETIINDTVLPALRALGFLIGEDVRMSFKNDAEVMQNANSLADIAVKIKNGGLQIDADYFTQQSGIKVSLPTPAPNPLQLGNKKPEDDKMLPPADDGQAKRAARLKTKMEAIYKRPVAE